MRSTQAPSSLRAKDEVMRRPSAGFTLVELLTVIAISAVLAALLFVGIQAAIDRAHGAKCASNLRGLGGVVQAYLADKNGAYPGVFWYAELAPYYGVPITETITHDMNQRAGALIGHHLRCPTHNRRIKKMHPGITADRLAKPDYALNLATGRFPSGPPNSWSRQDRRPFNFTSPSQIWMFTEAGFTANGAVGQLDTYWMGGINQPQGGSYTGGGVHNTHNNVLYLDGHVAPLIVWPKTNTTRYISQTPWDPIWGTP